MVDFPSIFSRKTLERLPAATAAATAQMEAQPNIDKQRMWQAQRDEKLKNKIFPCIFTIHLGLIISIGYYEIE